MFLFKTIFLAYFVVFAFEMHAKTIAISEEGVVYYLRKSDNFLYLMAVNNRGISPAPWRAGGLEIPFGTPDTLHVRDMQFSPDKRSLYILANVVVLPQEYGGPSVKAVAEALFIGRQRKAQNKLILLKADLNGCWDKNFGHGGEVFISASYEERDEGVAVRFGQQGMPLVVERAIAHTRRLVNNVWTVKSNGEVELVNISNPAYTFDPSELDERWRNSFKAVASGHNGELLLLHIGTDILERNTDAKPFVTSITTHNGQFLSQVVFSPPEEKTKIPYDASNQWHLHQDTDGTLKMWVLHASGKLIKYDLEANLPEQTLGEIPEDRFVPFDSFHTGKNGALSIMGRHLDDDKIVIQTFPGDGNRSVIEVIKDCGEVFDGPVDSLGL